MDRLAKCALCQKLFSYAVTAGVTIVNQGKENQVNKDQKQNISINYVSTIILGCYFLPSVSSVRTIVSFWWLFCIVVLATYSGNLIAFLAIDKHSTPFETLLELSKQNEYKFGTLGATGWEAVFNVIKTIRF